MSSALGLPKPGALPKLPPIKSGLLGLLPQLGTNFQGLLCQDAKNHKRRSKKKRLTLTPMEKEEHLQGAHPETTKDIIGKNNAENGQLSFQKHKAVSELEEDVESEDLLTVSTLLPPLPSLPRDKVGRQKSNDQKISFVPMKKKEQEFDMETAQPEKRPRSFLKSRPKSSQESDVKRDTSEDDFLELLESMNIDIADLADVLQDASASEGEIICQASSPQHDETDHEAGLAFLNTSLDQSYEEWLKLQPNTGALVSGCDLESDSEKPAPTATSPVSSEAFNKSQDELEKFEKEEEERLEAERKDRLESPQGKRQAEEKRMKEESAKELEELQETLKADCKRQELEIRKENTAILEIKSSLLGSLPTLGTNFQGRLCQDGKNPGEVRKPKSKKKHVTFAPMEKKEQGFDMETAQSEKRPRSFLKSRPKLSQERDDVKRDETSEDDGLDLFESMNLHIDIADLADVLQDGSASEGEIICQASSPQHDEADHEAGLDFLNTSLDQSHEEWLKLQSNTGAPGGHVSQEESSELGLVGPTPSSHSPLPPSPTPLS
uniref:Uncharacterized protein n=1 Tax=Knipowitschia caucasica TaxID=637954 RepID=A0AAV2KE92_KNICA